MDTGKYDNISLHEYHRMKGWSKSALDIIDKSPAHYLAWLRSEKESTPAQAFGSALHCAVLTPKLYEEQYAIAPECDKRTKTGKELYQDFLEKSAGKTPITSDQAAKIEEMKAALIAHPVAAPLLTNGEAEQSFFWIDPRTGLLCKCRPDYLRYDGICIDIKTTEDARFKAFQRSSYSYRYHVQGAYFTDGIFQATQKECSDFVIIAIEKEPPYGIMVYRLDDLAIDTGRVSYEMNLDTAKNFKEHPEKYTTVYPESESPVELSLPAWAD